MSLEDVMLRELGQSQKDKYCMMTHEVSKILKFVDSEKGMVVESRSPPGIRGEGNGEFLINEHKVSVKRDEQVLEVRLYNIVPSVSYT